MPGLDWVHQCRELRKDTVAGESGDLCLGLGREMWTFSATRVVTDVRPSPVSFEMIQRSMLSSGDDSAPASDAAILSTTTVRIRITIAIRLRKHALAP